MARCGAHFRPTAVKAGTALRGRKRLECVCVCVHFYVDVFAHVGREGGKLYLCLRVLVWVFLDMRAF